MFLLSREWGPKWSPQPPNAMKTASGPLIRSASVTATLLSVSNFLAVVPRTSVLPYHSCFLGVIAIFCNDVQILQCLASQAI